MTSSLNAKTPAPVQEHRGGMSSQQRAAEAAVIRNPCKTCRLPWSEDVFYSTGSECKVCKRARTKRNKIHNKLTPKAPRPSTKKLIMRIPESFWAQVMITDLGYWSPCLLWTGLKNSKGYGVYGWRKRNWFAHRLAYEMQVEPIPRDVKPRLTLDHLCRQRACVNIDHLDLVTDRENILRSDNHSARSLRTNTCPQGHEYTPENTRLPERGGRVCRTCERNKPAPKPQNQRTHCRAGHEYTDETVYVYPNGTRKCRICAAATRKAWQERQRSERTSSPADGDLESDLR